MTSAPVIFLLLFTSGVNSNNPVILETLPNIEFCAQKAAADMQKISAVNNRLREHPLPSVDMRELCVEMPATQALDCIRMEETKGVLSDPAASPSDRNRYMEVSRACDDHLAGIKP